MKKFSVQIENVIKDSGAQRLLQENPQVFRYIIAAISFVIEAALTAKMPELTVPVAGPDGCIDIQPDRIFLVAQGVNRVRCCLHTADFGPLMIRANIDFIDESGQVVLGLNATADSNGIRQIKKAYQRTSLPSGATVHIVS